jgi:hypothetical protein
LSKEDIKSSGDTYTPVLTFGSLLTPHIYLTLPGADTYVPVLSLAGTPTVVLAEVDIIRITGKGYGRIKVTPV